MKKKLVLIFLVFIMTFMSVVPPEKKVMANPVAIPVAVAAFIVMAASIGVTFNATNTFDAVKEAETVLNDFNRQKPPPPTFPAGKIVLAYYLGKALVELEDDAEENIKETVNAIKSRVQNLKSYFAERNVTEGENEFSTEVTYKSFAYNELLGDGNYAFVMGGNTYKFSFYMWYDSVTGSDRYQIKSPNGSIITFGDIAKNYYLEGIKIKGITADASLTLFSVIKRRDNDAPGAENVFTTYKPVPVDNKSYFDRNKIKIEPEAPVLNNSDPTFKKPDIKDHLTTTVDGQGRTQTTYNGSLDDLISDYVENMDITKPVTNNYYTVTEKKEVGAEPIVIVDVPGTNPYPEPETEEDEKTGLIQICVNWLKRIYDKIPDPQTQLDILDPTMPSENVKLDFSPLQNIPLKEVFPFCIPFDIVEVFENLLGTERTAPVFKLELPYDVDVNFDLSHFDFLATMGRTIFLILFIIALMKMTPHMPGIT